MPFPLAIRSPHQLSDELYPVVRSDDAGHPVALHAGDGEVRELVARSVTVRPQNNGHMRDGVSVRRGGVDVLVTDARVILVGARPTPDSLLVGHVLLDWVVAVGGSTSRRFFRDDALRLVIRMANGDYHVLTLVLQGDVDVHEVAQDIARRTAVRHLATHVGGARERAWQGLAGVAKQAAAPGEFALHWMPTHVAVPLPGPAVERIGVPA